MSGSVHEAEVRNLKDFLGTLSITQNMCNALDSYLKFQDNLDPRIRALILVNGAFMMVSAAKGTIKSLLDQQYQNLSQPPAVTHDALVKTRTDIDTIAANVESSLKEILLVLQNQTGIIPQPINR